MEPKEFLEALVKCYTPSGEEAPAAKLAVNTMSALGYREAFIDEAGNAVGVWGKEGGERVLLLGHIDTVPGEIKVRRETVDGKEILHGRGAVDAKGPFATFVQAVSRLPKDVPVEIRVVGATEEELPSSKGARFIGESLAEPQCVIIGEPSGGDGITLGYKGRLLHELRIRRTMDHSASANRSVGDYLVDWGSRIQSYAKDINGDKPKGFPTLDEKVQKLTVSDDGLYEEGLLQIGFRLGPDFNPHELGKELSEILDDWVEQNRGEDVLELAPKFYLREVPAVYSKKGTLPQVFRQAIRHAGMEPRHVFKTGTSDMNVLAANWQCEMVAYGPGDSHLDHTPHEHIVLSEYEISIAVLTKALELLVVKFGDL